MLDRQSIPLTGILLICIFAETPEPVDLLAIGAGLCARPLPVPFRDVLSDLNYL